MKFSRAANALRSIVLLLACVVGSNCSLAVAAEDTSTHWFSRVTTMAEIDEAGVYVIGAVYPKDSNLYLMSCELQGPKKGDKWLSATNLGTVETPPEVLTTSDDSCLWRFEPNEESGWVIKSNGSGRMLRNETQEDAADTHITLSCNSSTPWAISNSEGCFYISRLDGLCEGYYLALNYNITNGKASMKFGHYKSYDSNVLYLYKLVTDDANDADARATLMTDGASVAVCAKTALATTSFEAVSLSDKLLTNGKVAADERVGEWTYRSRDDSCFVLQNSEGKSLDYTLAPNAEEHLWRVSNGRLVTLETTPRALCFDNGFKLVDVDSITTERRVRLRGVVQPDSTISGDVKTLSGGWTSGRLAAMSWDGVRTLDLTGLSMPVAGLTDFANRPAEANTIIYISKECADLVPADWNFVVVRSEEGDTLWTTTLLHDREALSISKDIAYSASQLSYQRALYDDTAWETLYLPFNAEVDDDYELCQFKSIEDDALKFEKGRAITAYTPLLLRRTSESAGTTFLVTASTDGVLYSSPTDASDTFVGTLMPIDITSESEGKYLLNATGEAFKLAGAQSTLKPFRAYIQRASTSSTLRLQFDDDATNITSAASIDDDTTPHSCYTIDGRLVAPLMTREAVQHLPRGLYIYGGKMLIVK